MTTQKTTLTDINGNSNYLYIYIYLYWVGKIVKIIIIIIIIINNNNNNNNGLISVHPWYGSSPDIRVKNKSKQ